VARPFVPASLRQLTRPITAAELRADPDLAGLEVLTEHQPPSPSIVTRTQFGHLAVHLEPVLPVTELPTLDRVS
jgi:hypothetical protein